MTTDQATALLDAFRAGRATRDDVLRAFQAAPVADLGFAQVDTHRALRKGFPEVIFGAGKTPAQVAAIAARLVAREQNVLVTRITAEHARRLKRHFKRAVWHEAGGWAMREVLGQPKAMVPANKAVAATGYRLMVPLHYVHASYVRSHYNSVEIGIQDAPRPNEILFALVMGTGGRVHSRLGGLTKDKVSVHDGQR